MHDEEWENDGTIAFEMAIKVVDGTDEHRLHVLLDPRSEPITLTTEEAREYGLGLIREATRALYMEAMHLQIHDIAGDDDDKDYQSEVMQILVEGLVERTPVEEKGVKLGDLMFHAALTHGMHAAIGILRDGRPLGGMPAQYIFEHANEVLRGVEVARLNTAYADVMRVRVDVDDREIRHHAASNVGFRVAMLSGTITEDGSYVGGEHARKLMPDGVDEADWVGGQKAEPGGSIQ